ncbi:MAG TPA: hypothetical protein VGR00_10390, partial [Thermoanaerobaculia bacterium]|nr:hypothetical protein [Thermoanaerobaculia bacterium]
MKPRRLPALLTAAFLLAANAPIPGAPLLLVPEAAEGSASGDSAQDAAYDEGKAALDAKRWDKALQAFEKAAASKGGRTDAALYWKAYAESRLGRRGDAAETLVELKRRFPKSRWAKDAASLELELHQG